MKKVIIILIKVFVVSAALHSQNIKTPSIEILSEDSFYFFQTGTLPKTLAEASGLESFKENSYWTHNDGNKNILYNIDSNGNLIKTVHLINKNNGWEDLTKDSNGNLYIGGFGNNGNDKNNLRILKIRNPDSIEQKVIVAEVIQFFYEDQLHFPPDKPNMNFDVDAFICYRDSLYLFTKNRTEPYNGIIKTYSLPLVPGNYKATLSDSFRLPGNNQISNWITGADLSPDENKIVLLFHDKILIIDEFSERKFSAGRFQQINLNHISHKAGICFSEQNELIIVDEKELNIFGGNIYKLVFNNSD